MILISLATVALGACGTQKSTLPPSPGGSGAISLHELANYPEVYAGAQVSTVGTVARADSGHERLYVLDGGGGKRIVLEPSSSAAPQAGRRVAVKGLFTVTFQLGYEILISRIAPVGSL